jgi:hypothetical protein
MPSCRVRHMATLAKSKPVFPGTLIAEKLYRRVSELVYQSVPVPLSSGFRWNPFLLTLDQRCAK